MVLFESHSVADTGRSYLLFQVGTWRPEETKRVAEVARVCGCVRQKQAGTQFGKTWFLPGCGTALCFQCGE